MTCFCVSVLLFFPFDKVWFANNCALSSLFAVYPFYTTNDVDMVQHKVKKGETGYIDPRYKEHSFAEATLVRLIEKCWIYDPDERIDIFELLRELRTAMAEVTRRQQEK